MLRGVLRCDVVCSGLMCSDVSFIALCGIVSICVVVC